MKKSAKKNAPAFKTLKGTAKIQYLWDYYKLELAVICILLYIAGYSIYGHITHKDTVLYTGLVNVVAGDTLTGQLSEDFLYYMDIDTSQNRFVLYSGWFLTDDSSSEYYQYAYASRMKVLASIDAQQLDVVLMNREAFDAFAQNGFLCDLDQFLASDPDLHRAAGPYLESNIEILEDNAQELIYDPSLEYVSTTREYPMAVNLSQTALIESAGFEEDVYLGVIANTPRKEMAADYLRYLLSGS